MDMLERNDQINPCSSSPALSLSTLGFHNKVDFNLWEHKSKHESSAD